MWLPKVESFSWRVEQGLIREGGFAMITGDPGYQLTGAFTPEDTNAALPDGHYRPFNAICGLVAVQYAFRGDRLLSHAELLGSMASFRSFW